MKTYSGLFFLFLLLGALGAKEHVLSASEAKILTLVLESSYEDQGYTVVKPFTNLSGIDDSNIESIKKEKEFIKENLKIKDFDITRAIDDLLRKNKTPLRLNLKSDSLKGYIIDYKEKYQKYFDGNGGGWDSLYRENPKAHGLTTVSRPGYDKHISK